MFAVEEEEDLRRCVECGQLVQERSPDFVLSCTLPDGTQYAWCQACARLAPVMDSLRHMADGCPDCRPRNRAERRAARRRR